MESMQIYQYKALNIRETQAKLYMSALLILKRSVFWINILISTKHYISYTNCQSIYSLWVFLIFMKYLLIRKNHSNLNFFSRVSSYKAKVLAFLNLTLLFLMKNNFKKFSTLRLKIKLIPNSLAIPLFKKQM